MVLNYIGSKKLLGPALLKILQERIPDFSTRKVLDGFGGTGSMSLVFQPACRQVIANDLESYAVMTLRGHLESEWNEKLEALLEELDHLEPDPDRPGIITRCYSPLGGRMFFTEENARRMDTVRETIQEWFEEERITHHEYYYLLACLLESADKRANVSCVYGAYLKNWKRSALEKFRIEPIHKHASYGGEVHQGDVQDFVRHCEPGSVLYLDPPYNQRQYGSNYFVLNVLCEYKEIEPVGITGIPSSGYNKSLFCRKSEASEALKNILTNTRAEWVCLSYNNEGLMSRDEMVKIYEDAGYQVEVHEIDYKKFKAQKSVKESSTVEYLFVGHR